MSIYATLHNHPTARPAHEMIYITRGASATLTFNLFDQVYSFADIDQITFLLNQEELLYWYTMFTYLIKSADTEVIPGKYYFTDVELLAPNSGSLQCKGTLVAEPSGNPLAQGYFEAVEGNHGKSDTWHLVDPRFSYLDNAGYESIMLTLCPEETKQFNPTKIHEEIAFEIVIRLDTDHLPQLAMTDSTIIESQHPILVRDSLYSKI